MICTTDLKTCASAEEISGRQESNLPPLKRPMMENQGYPQEKALRKNAATQTVVSNYETVIGNLRTFNQNGINPVEKKKNKSLEVRMK